LDFVFFLAFEAIEEELDTTAWERMKVQKD
jgi:hypothetical protein